MSVEKLILSLKKGGRLRQEAILEAAREESEKILAGAREKVSVINSQIEHEKEKLAEKIKRIENSRKTVRARAEMSSLVKRYTDSIKALCRENYRKFMESGVYNGFIKNQMENVRNELKDVSEFRADARTARVISPHIKGAEKVMEDASVNEGFVAVSKDGRVKVWCDLATMMEKAWSYRAPDIVKKVHEVVKNVD